MAILSLALTRSAFKRARDVCLLTIVLLAASWPGQIAASEVDGRDGIEFTIENATLVNINNLQYLSLDIMASSPDTNQRLGTGIILLNYSTDSFGNSVKANANVIVSKGVLLTTNPFPMYNLYVQDHSSSRVAVTYEYTSTSGYGNLLGSTPQRLVNIKLEIQSTGFYSGLYFQANLMENQQYLDDNSTLFNPVIATDTENAVIPTQPQEPVITLQGGSCLLAWQPCVGCTYSVYSADTLDALAWQLEIEGLVEAQWNIAPQLARRFYRVTSTGLVAP
jgi:hypothetical protein